MRIIVRNFAEQNMEQQKRYTNALLEKIIAYILNNPVKAGI